MSTLLRLWQVSSCSNSIASSGSSMAQSRRTMTTGLGLGFSCHAYIKCRIKLTSVLVTKLTCMKKRPMRPKDLVFVSLVLLYAYKASPLYLILRLLSMKLLERCNFNLCFDALKSAFNLSNRTLIF